MELVISMSVHDLGIFWVRGREVEMTSSYNLDKLARCLTVLSIDFYFHLTFLWTLLCIVLVDS